MDDALVVEGDEPVFDAGHDDGEAYLQRLTILDAVLVSVVEEFVAG